MKKLALVAVISCIATAAQAAPQFLSYEGKDAIQEGRGGSKRIVDGIDFWLEGQPPRKFQVLGILTDERHETGIIGMVRMSGLDSDVAKAAKQAGGDAVILTAEGERITGIASSGGATVTTNGAFGNAFGSSFSRAIKNHQSRYVVVRYLPDPPASAAAPQQ